jgi:hypothetical protein
MLSFKQSEAMESRVEEVVMGDLDVMVCLEQTQLKRRMLL